MCSNALIMRDITRGRKVKTSQNAHISVCYARIHELSHILLPPLKSSSLVYTASVLNIYNFVPLSKRNTLNSSSIRENLFVITHNPQINKASLEEQDHLLLTHCGYQSVQSKWNRKQCEKQTAELAVFSKLRHLQHHADLQAA